jgi:phage terminase large subunit-like protein
MQPSSERRSGRQPDVPLKARSEEELHVRRERLLALPKEERRRVVRDMTPGERKALNYDWRFWRRASQAPPVDDAWRYWLLCAGRGYGKTRVGAEFVRQQVHEGRARRVGLVGRTLGEAVKIMVQGQSGIMAVTPPEERPVFIENKRLLVWPNGAVGDIYTSEEPNGMRGPGLDLVWGDELAAWIKLEESWTQIDMMLRNTGPLGDPARAVLTTTPRPLKTVRALLKDPMARVTRGSTYENAQNLDPVWLQKLLDTYEGTRTGRQELRAEILDDIEGALWTRATIENCRTKDYPDLVKVVVAIDPAVSSKSTSAETGIVVVGAGVDGHVYILEDCSGRLSPEGWGRRAVDAYERHCADYIVGEANNGGDLVASNIAAVDDRVPVQLVHASRGKRRRAEPVATLYAREHPTTHEPMPRVHHVGGMAKLEDQMCSWDGQEGSESPDRMDAMVWGVTEVALSELGLLNAGFA